MSYEIAKIALLILLCVPLILLAFGLLVNVFGENYKIRKKNKAAARARRAQEKEFYARQARRKKFDEDYDRFRGGY